MKNFFKLFVAMALIQPSLAFSDVLDISAVMTPKEQIKMEFKDGTGHFVLMVKREGQAIGKGLFAGTSVTEFGRHDIIPGVSGDPSGYLILSQGEANIAYIKWTVRAIFLPDKNGKPQLNDNGFWEVVSGTGIFKGLKGAGTLHIKPASSPTARTFILEGETSLPRS
ncbi:hypothetical protein ACX1N0_13945 [Acinetobacter sp. ANC 4635]|uniref:hypothetical protein n=1 Tax=Acinetobacter sp. ANC 4635 TaxID=2529846 RepID=UPI001BC89589|nr:hypothetical protein [Acinetobacter sp. ANC 4635]